MIEVVWKISFHNYSKKQQKILEVYDSVDSKRNHALTIIQREKQTKYVNESSEPIKNIGTKNQLPSLG